MSTAEQVPNFTKGELVLCVGKKAVILSVTNYCHCCDRFLPTPHYSILELATKEVTHRVSQEYIDYYTDEQVE